MPRTLVKNLLTLIFLICLSASCTSAPTIEDKEQCSIDLKLIEADGLRIVNEDESTCRCRKYRRSENYIGPIGDVYNMDVTYCQKLIGETPLIYVEVQNFYEALRVYYRSRANESDN